MTAEASHRGRHGKGSAEEIANLDWASLRQNIEDAFRRFETSLTEQLFRASEETRQAMEIALQKRSARSAEVGALIAEFSDRRLS